ncbi:EXS (ERD1/XPR1/SYG1) family protein [Actinidia rufa]|uniref:EXS (ERD1/XPR1/SYG1) family protein n=1 Tax=Actinidia rufa TaxID=165716 RepID=A0A7J0FNP0_9ERIC|nr:EXS (ERD1/XPR1/SYG1) family protein [Actinidia rufa]
MVKFSKQFEGQLIPEWKEAFVDYWQLKKDLKKIHLLNGNNTPTNQKQRNLPNTLVSSIRKISLFGHQHREHGVIQVHKKLASSASKGDLYETELLEQFADTDAPNDFFACLDLQLNKVNQFYRVKEGEFLERGDSLKKQMAILVDLKSALKQQHGKGSSSQEMKEDDSVSGTISCGEDSSRGKSELEQVQDSTTDELDSNAAQFTDSTRSDEMGESLRMKRGEGKLMRALSGHAFNCQGKNLRINIPVTNPTRTFSAITYLLWDDLVNQSSKKCGPEGSKIHINKTKLHHAEKMIRGAFVELYKGLGYLKTYRNLNMLAFVKILKKFDKVTNKQVLPIYLRVVERSYFNSSDKVMKLADEVEEIFIKNFAEDDKRKAMKYLKPTQREESHGVTFFIACSVCCFYTSFCMDATFSCGEDTRINYTFIFELSPTKDLKYRDVFLICTASMAAVMGILFVHLSLVAKGYFLCSSSSNPCPSFTGICTGSFAVKSLSLLTIRSRPEILAPRDFHMILWLGVVMLDFFMADQLCSQVPMLRNLEYVMCYYITGSFKTQDYGYCMRTKNYRDLAYAVSFLPYYWRAMQCARRWFDEGQTSHLVNLGKYVSAMLAAGAKVVYEKERNVGWLCLLVIMSSGATLYQLYWDFVKDWGLLQFHCKNPCFGSVDYRITGLFLAALEVIRRGHWNFYRLENEHLNNVGKFRAVKTVPLPFHEVDDQD